MTMFAAPGPSVVRHTPGLEVSRPVIPAMNAALATWGQTHVVTPLEQACVDSKHRMISAPAYMYGDANPAEVFASIQEQQPKSGLLGSLRRLFMADAPTARNSNGKPPTGAPAKKKKNGKKEP